MGRNVAAKLAGLTLTGAALLTIGGCQSASGPVQLTVIPDDSLSLRTGDAKETPYINPIWQENDEPIDPVQLALTTTGTALGAVITPVVEPPAQGIRWLSGDRPSRAVTQLEDDTSPDNRREGINKLVDFGFLRQDSDREKKTAEIFEKRCREIATLDQDYTVRATAIRTANRARDPKATPLFVRSLSDPNEWVRLEAAKALVNVPDVAAVDSLRAVASDHEPNRDVRVAAVDALKHYRTLSVARDLVSMLHDKSFATAWQAHRSLKYLFNRDFGYDEAAWLNYFAGPERPLG